jgi:hypothetical protein
MSDVDCDILNSDVLFAHQSNHMFLHQLFGIKSQYKHPPSSSVGPHVLIPRNLSVLSSTNIV